MAGNGKILQVRDLIADAMDETGVARAAKTTFDKGSKRVAIVVHDVAMGNRAIKDIERSVSLSERQKAHTAIAVNGDMVPPGGIVVGDWANLNRKVITNHYAQRRTGTP